MKEITKVYESRDYDKFKILLGNRSIIPIQVSRLEQSMSEQFLLSPIIVNSDFEIIDGQHRFEACKRLNLPIQYIDAGPDYGLKQVQLLNTHQKNWSKVDYLHAFCELGYTEYINLKKFQMYYGDFSINTCEMLLTNNSHHVKSAKDSTGKLTGKKSGWYSTKHFAKGEFKIVDYDLACESAEKLLQVKEHYKGYNRRSFVSAMLSTFKVKYYEHDRFIQRLKTNPAALANCVNAEQYRYLIEEIYNFRSHEKVSLRYIHTP